MGSYLYVLYLYTKKLYFLIDILDINFALQYFFELFLAMLLHLFDTRIYHYTS